MPVVHVVCVAVAAWMLFATSKKSCQDKIVQTFWFRAFIIIIITCTTGAHRANDDDGHRDIVRPKSTHRANSPKGQHFHFNVYTSIRLLLLFFFILFPNDTLFCGRVPQMLVHRASVASHSVQINELHLEKQMLCSIYILPHVPACVSVQCLLCNWLWRASLP